MNKYAKHPIIVQVSVPNKETAELLAEHLVREKLVACAQIIPGMTSMYMWEDKLETESELLLVLKTFNTQFKTIVSVITEKHPYEVPEIISVRVSEMTRNYSLWMDSVIRS